MKRYETIKGESVKESKSLFQKIRGKASGKIDEQSETVEHNEEEDHQMLEEFEAVKRNPGQISGWDFDRAFDFIERYPDTPQAEILVGQMYATKGQALKGLSYMSAVKVLDRMPGHAGSDAIIRGMLKVESDFIKELHSDVIAYMLKIIPDHPLADELTTALAVKNLTNAFNFVVKYPDNGYVRQIIRAMFERDPNISVLLFQEKMDHPHVGSIFEGIYGIDQDTLIKKLTPSAIIFILDVAPDHPQASKMLEVLVERNYVRAYDFVKMHPDHALVPELKELILVRKPELKDLFDIKE